ncbi:MAG TPA: methyltransferase domain-containing protein [Jatrophihabitantaceae bacterium]|jgi:SAM-dependent methyltransferase
MKLYRRQRNLRAAEGVAPEQIWAGALDEETAFWRSWFATKGSEWPDDYRFRLDPESQIQEQITKYLDGIGHSVRILDVGAGPLTFVGKRWSGHDLNLTAVDALADKYDALLAEFEITPPVRTRNCDSEKLTQVFDENSFEVAYALNTLDHSYEPIRAIRQMLAVVRPGGIVLLQHYPNEAENEAYSGLHQWNFDWIDGDCVLWRPGKSWQLGKEFAGQATVSGSKADGVVTTVITKATPGASAVG